MNELWVLFVLVALPPPGLITGYSTPYATRQECVREEQRVKAEALATRTPYAKASLVTYCARLK